MTFICVVQGFPEFVFKWYMDAGIVWLFYWYILWVISRSLCNDLVHYYHSSISDLFVCRL